jgi:hypothetical protein
MEEQYMGVVFYCNNLEEFIVICRIILLEEKFNLEN